MPLTLKRITLALATLAFAVPAFAGDLTGVNITRYPPAGCNVVLQRVFQDSGNRIHVTIRNQGNQATGKLLIETNATTGKVSDTISWGVFKGATSEFTAPRSAGAVVTGKDVTIAFTECAVSKGTSQM